MATQRQVRRGTAAQMAGFTGAEGELTWIIDGLRRLIMHDGVTAGGFPTANLADIIHQEGNFVPSPGGTSNAIDLTAGLSPNPTLKDATRVGWRQNGDSSAAGTLKVNADPAKALRKGDGSVALVALDLLDKRNYYATYNLADDIWLLEGSGVGGGGGGLRSMQFFSADGVWTKPAGVTILLVICIGGGGGGGRESAASPTPGGGGGGGGVSIKVVDASILTSETITIGTGGTFPTNTNTNGPTGGTTSFGAIMTATGGQGGNSNGNAGVGGTGTLGDANIQGSPGHRVGSLNAPGASGVLGGLGAGGDGALGSGVSGTAGRDGAVIVLEF